MKRGLELSLGEVISSISCSLGETMRIAGKRPVLTALTLAAFQLAAFEGAIGQTAATQDSPAANPPVATTPESVAVASNAQPVGGAPGVQKSFVVPAGTKVLLQLRSALNTKSAKPGDGVYLASTFPVVVGNRVMIPSGVYVQGVVDRVVRAGHVSGRSQLDMHFTSIIFPNGTVVEIPGIVNSLPGASKQKVKSDGEGTIEQETDKGRNAAKTAEIAIPTGGTVGSISGIDSGHPLAGGLAGIGAGLATVGLVTLFTRGADVNIESGSQVEMVLQRPLILVEANLSATAGASLVPSENQPKPLEKPGKPVVLCPAGGLGCQ